MTYLHRNEVGHLVAVQTPPPTPERAIMDAHRQVIAGPVPDSWQAALAASRMLYVLEVAPAQAKRALAQQGNADKAAMQAAAVDYGVRGEHASDALGVALAARPRVRVEAL